MIDNFPAHFLMDYVRVYQRTEVANSTEQSQSIGCSTPRYPTAEYIKAHASAYKSKTDEAPLKPVATGGAKCRPEGEGKTGYYETRNLGGGPCGFGNCVKGHCVCWPNFTGPNCKVPTNSYTFAAHISVLSVMLSIQAAAAFNDVKWENAHANEMVLFEAPIVLVGFAVTIFVLLITAAAYKTVKERREAAAREIAYVRVADYVERRLFADENGGIETTPLQQNSAVVHVENSVFIPEHDEASQQTTTTNRAGGSHHDNNDFSVGYQANAARKTRSGTK
jgi:hypothetical protein